MKKNKYIFWATSLLVLILTTSSCFGVKIKGGNNSPSNKLYETFYIENGVTQNFIKPLSLESNISKDNSFDITFRKGEDKLSPTIINLTAFSNEVFSGEESVFLNSGEIEIQGSEIEIIFTEKKDELFKNRITLKVPYNELLKIINSSDKENFNIKITSNSGDLILKLSNKSIKNLDKLQSIFF